MTIVNTIEYWLKLVGAQYSITPSEVHHVFRPDTTLAPWREHFVFRFEDSQDSNQSYYDNSSAETGFAADIDIVRSYHRTLTVEAHHEDGMTVLEALRSSPMHPSVKDILNNGRNKNNEPDASSSLVIVDMGSIENKTTYNETETDHAYQMRFRVRKHTHFNLQQTDHLVENIGATGIIYTAGDPPADLEVSVETDIGE